MAKKAKTAITPTRDEDFPQWYQNVIKAADMAENAPVRGCMIIKPYGYAVWENIQKNFDRMIKLEGVQNAYFPLLIPLSYIGKEAEHVDGFAKECAVVTHHRLEADTENGGLKPAGELAEPMVIRPTSETIIGESFSRWIQSYRDLPLKLNQWANVMRWEMRTRLFLRTSEFLWQEGHNCFETAEQANADARRMLDVYVEFVTKYLAMPCIKGVKTPDERFPGAVETYTFETIMQDGKALQSGTSHDLGQTFARSANITFQNRDGEEALAHTTSWGISTRLIGGLIMMHGDDDGMMMPPKIAPYPIILIPIIRDEEDRDALVQYCGDLQAKLDDKGIFAHIDDRHVKTPDKLWGSIKKGVPLRVEIGAREMAEGQVTHTRRDIGRDSKTTCSTDEFVDQAQAILDDIQDNLYKRAEKQMLDMIYDVETVSDIKNFFDKADKIGVVKAPISVLDDAELEAVMDAYSLTTRCIPFADNGEKVIIGKAY